MSSVTRFIRQIPVSTTYYNAAQVAGSDANVQQLVYEFAPSSSNYVGNYPAGYNSTNGGYVAPASAALVNAIGAARNSLGINALVLRDMGKTIFAPIGSTAGGVLNPPGTTPSFGYFRQVQLLSPNVITQGPGFMGGTNGNTFGVLGGANIPDNFTDYLTFYIPVTVAGITGAAVNTQAFALAGGQM